MLKSLMKFATVAVLAGVAGPVWADVFPYSNARFGVTGLVPDGFIAQPAPANGDGRMFVSPNGAVTVTIYGSYDAMGDLAAYRDFLFETYSDSGTVTYQAGGADWFVLSGLEAARVFYLRVKQGQTCAGDVAYAHLYVRYDEVARDQIDPILGTLGRGLGFAPC